MQNAAHKPLRVSIRINAPSSLLYVFPWYLRYWPKRLTKNNGGSSRNSSICGQNFLLEIVVFRDGKSIFFYDAFNLQFWRLVSPSPAIAALSGKTASVWARSTSAIAAKS